MKAAGYGVIEFNKPNADDKTDITYGFHPVGNTGHDIGPSLTTWQPLQSTFTLHLQHLFSFEYFAYTPIAGMGRQEAAHPDRGRRDADGARDSVRAPGELPAARDQVSSGLGARG